MTCNELEIYVRRDFVMYERELRLKKECARNCQGVAAGY